MGIKNWDKGEVHRVFNQFCGEYTKPLYLKTLQ